MYAPSGVVEGELVYCNAGREIDLQLLDSMNITVKDRIVLVKGQGGSVSSNKLSKSSNIERFVFECRKIMVLHQLRYTKTCATFSSNQK